MKMKNKSRRYNIDRPICLDMDTKNTKYKNCITVMVLKCI